MASLQHLFQLAECCEELTVLAVVEREHVLLHLHMRVRGKYQRYRGSSDDVQRYRGSTDVVQGCISTES